MEGQIDGILVEKFELNNDKTYVMRPKTWYGEFVPFVLIAIVVTLIPTGYYKHSGGRAAWRLLLIASCLLAIFINLFWQLYWQFFGEGGSSDAGPPFGW